MFRDVGLLVLALWPGGGAAVATEARAVSNKVQEPHVIIFDVVKGREEQRQAAGDIFPPDVAQVKPRRLRVQAI